MPGGLKPVWDTGGPFVSGGVEPVLDSPFILAGEPGGIPEGAFPIPGIRGPDMPPNCPLPGGLKLPAFPCAGGPGAGLDLFMPPMGPWLTGGPCVI